MIVTPRHTAARRPRAIRHARKLRSHPFARGAALAVAAVLSFGATGVATAYVRLENNIETHDVTALLGEDRPVKLEPVDPTDARAGEPLNILLIGSDVRAEDAADAAEVDGMRSDTTIVMHISADRQRVELVSIPRDSHVQIPECVRTDGSTTRARDTRFNEAFSLGGQSGLTADAAACTIKTVESLTGVFIDGWVVVDFAGFTSMVDALGGIPICIPNDMESPKAGLSVTAGQQVLDGTTALAFARARTGTGVGDGSDTNRLGRQQQLLAATANTVFSKNLLTDSAALYRFLTAATGSLTTDTELGSISNLAGLAFSLRNIPPANIVFMTIPFASYPADPNQVVWTSDAAQVWSSIASDLPVVAAPAPVVTAEPSDGATADPSATTDPAVAPTEAPVPGVDPFTPADVTAVCG